MGVSVLGNLAILAFAQPMHAKIPNIALETSIVVLARIEVDCLHLRYGAHHLNLGLDLFF